MFPPLNPTAHLRSDSEISILKLCCEGQISYGSGSQTGPQHAYMSKGIVTKTDNHKMSSYHTTDTELQHNSEKHCFSQERAAHFPKALTEPVFICNRQPKVALCSAWQSDDWCRGEEWPLVFPSLTRSHIHQPSNCRSISFSTSFLCILLLHVMNKVSLIADLLKL